MPQYSQYLEVRSDYIPVFSSETDQKEPTTWKHFIPHISMRDLIVRLIRSICREKNENIKSMYVTGGYGTGKTFGAFVIKHLLEESIDESREYFQNYSILRQLWPEFEAVRSGARFLVIYRSGSAEIGSSERLLMEVQYSIREALRRNNYQYMGVNSLQEAIYNRIADSKSTFDWPKAFAKYRELFMDFKAADEVVDKLANNTKLAERVLRVLEKEGVGLLNTVEETKNWIEDVIRENGIKAIVFIWDEFADYFKQNPAITTLQELAHCVIRMPFYLYLITHLSVEQIPTIDNETRKKLMDRFFDIRFEMNPVTANQLIANAIVVKPLLREEWDVKSHTLYSMVEQAVSKLQDDSVRKEDFMRLVPIHPFSAYLLSAISRQFTSSQRTLFQFLKEAPDAAPGGTRHSFNWFINNHSIDDWSWLTPDILWDYFFTLENHDFEQEIRHYILHFENAQLRLQDQDEKRVLKCVLLFMAMYGKVKAEILRPMRSNIELAFSGTPVRDKLQVILYNLVRADMLSEASVGINDATYMIPMAFEDKEKFERVLSEVKREYLFAKVAEARRERKDTAKGGELGTKVLDLFKPTPVQEARIQSWSTALSNLRIALPRIQKDLKPYQLALLFTLLETEAQRVNLEKQIMDCGAMNERIAVVALDTPFGGDRFEKWQLDVAKQKYASLPEIRNSNAKVFAHHAAGHIEDWINQVRVVKTSLFYKNKRFEFIGPAGIIECLHQIIASEYQYGPETLILLEPLYSTSLGKDPAIKGMGLKPPTNPYTNLVDVLTKAGFWHKDSTMSGGNTDHPVSRMRAKIEEMFQGETSVSLAGIWEELMKPPFGMMPSPISLFLWGFLMRDFTRGGYYLKDEYNTQPVHGDKLAEYLDVVVKGFSKDIYRYEISKMRQDDEDFCRMMKSIFRFSEEQAANPIEVKKNIRRCINEVRYPLWVLNYLNHPLANEFSDTNIVGLICQFVGTESQTRESELVTSIVDVLVHLKDGGRQFLSELIHNSLSDGMKEYIRQTAPTVLIYASKAHIQFSEVMSVFRSRVMNEDKWLWQEESVREKLADLEEEYALLDAINTLLQSESKSLDDARVKCRSIFDNAKLPWPVLRLKAGVCAEAFEVLLNFLKAESRFFAEKRKLADLLNEHTQAMRDLLKAQKDALTHYVSNVLKLDIANEDLDQIYSELTIFGLFGNQDNFVLALRREVTKLQTQIMLGRLKRAWLDITGSESPAEWSRNSRMPILWLTEMKDDRMAEIFDILNGKPVRYDVQSLEHLLTYFESVKDRLSVLRDARKVDEVFLSSAGVDEYAFVICPEELKNYIAERLGTNVYAWAMKTADVARLARQFLGELYQRSVYIEVFKKIDSMPAERAKDYLKELIKKNEIVGLNILKGDPAR